MLTGYLSATSPKQQETQDIDIEELERMSEKLKSVAGMMQPQEDTDGTTS